MPDQELGQQDDYGDEDGQFDDRQGMDEDEY